MAGPASSLNISKNPSHATVRRSYDDVRAYAAYEWRNPKKIRNAVQMHRTRSRTNVKRSRIPCQKRTKYARDARSACSESTCHPPRSRLSIVTPALPTQKGLIMLCYTRSSRCPQLQMIWAARGRQWLLCVGQGVDCISVFVFFPVPSPSLFQLVAAGAAGVVYGQQVFPGMHWSWLASMVPVVLITRTLVSGTVLVYVFHFHS